MAKEKKVKVKKFDSDAFLVEQGFKDPIVEVKEVKEEKKE